MKELIKPGPKGDEISNRHALGTEMRKKEQVQRERQAYIYTEGVLGMRPMLE